MSDTDDTLEAMDTRLRELELDHVQLAGRIMQLREDRTLYLNGPRRRPGRPRKAADIVEMPERVAGAMHETQVEETVA